MGSFDGRLIGSMVGGKGGGGRVSQNSIAIEIAYVENNCGLFCLQYVSGPCG